MGIVPEDNNFIANDNMDMRNKEFELQTRSFRLNLIFSTVSVHTLI